MNTPRNLKEARAFLEQAQTAAHESAQLLAQFVRDMHAAERARDERPIDMGAHEVVALMEAAKRARSLVDVQRGPVAQAESELNRAQRYVDDYERLTEAAQGVVVHALNEHARAARVAADAHDRAQKLTAALSASDWEVQRARAELARLTGEGAGDGN